jgi:hypothetical protein
MGKMGSMFNRLTGAAARHNQALSDVRDWAVTVEKFLVGYGLMDESAGLDLLLGNGGDAKFDLTGLSYTGRRLALRSGDIRHKKVPPLVADIINDVESIRRYLMNPSLQSEKLAETATALRSSFRTLQDTLAEIEYL